jgi:hypothetical protein
MTASVTGRGDLEPILRLLLRFLDLSRDLERNRDDTSFRDDNGRISYVLDENVFEIFIRPFIPRGELVSLHSRHWAVAQQDHTGHRYVQTSFPAQSALLTSEYLFSGELPGQTDSRLFMTEWHRWELARRVQKLNAEYGRRLQEATEAELVERFQDLRMVLDYFSEGESTYDNVEAFDADLRQDTADLAHAPLNVRKSFVSTRLAVKILAEDDDVEPAEQLLRIVTKPIRQRISTLHLSYRSEDSERNTIAKDAHKWLTRLVAECRARGIDVVEKQSDDSKDRDHARSQAALRDDAKSLAQIRWAAVHGVKAGERLVFITADSLLFDTYRKWYANLQPGSTEYLEPFILRRIIQYAPIFNMADSRNVLGNDVRVFFEQLQSVLEITLLPLNLSRLKGTAGEEVLTRMREITALRLLDKTPISRDQRYAELTRALERREIEVDAVRLNNLLSQWRRLERTSLGLAGDYVRARLGEKERRHQDLKLLIQSDEASAKAAFKDYIGGLIEHLLEGSRDFWLPLAREFIDSWQPRRGHHTRAPIPFQLELNLGNSTINLGQILDRRLNSDDKTPIVMRDAWPALHEASDIVFAIAACLALVSDDWGNADHFAEMALRADNARWSGLDGALRVQSRQLHELKYLNALTKRFRIGALAPPLNVDSLSKTKQGYRAARELLDACVDFHEMSELDGAQGLRLIRALSERAALHLFYAAGLTPAVRLAAERRLTPKDRADIAWAEHRAAIELDRSRSDAGRERLETARRALASAEVDLRRCLHHETMLRTPRDDGNAGFFKKLEFQFLVNIAAAAVLARLLDASPQLDTNDGKALCLRVADATVIARINTLLASVVGTVPSLLQAEMLAFLGMCGDEAAQSRLVEIERVSSSGMFLSLDVALLDAISDAAALFGRR